MNATKENLSQLRQTMVDCQLRTFDITDQAVLERVAEVPREDFLPAKQRALAYSDCTIELSSDSGPRVLLAPMVLARMIQSADIETDNKVMCVGDPTGYAAAILSGLADQVINLECDRANTAQSEENLSRLGITNVKSVTGPLTDGASSHAPFNVIIVCGATGKNPTALLRQLASAGRLVMIESSGNGHSGRVVRCDSSAGGHGTKALFSATATILPGFASKPEFVF